MNPAPGHAPVKVVVTGDTQAVIDPMLLNVNEQIVINIIIYRDGGVPLMESPYSDDSGILSWSADIKGADLSVVGLSRVDFPTISPIKGLFSTWFILVMVWSHWFWLVLCLADFKLRNSVWENQCNRSG